MRKKYSIRRDNALTYADIRAVCYMPDGWFVPGQLSKMLGDRWFRCERLAEMGWIEQRPNTDYRGNRVTQPFEYRKTDKLQTHLNEKDT